MKKVILFLPMLVSFLFAFGQQVNSSTTLTKADYLKKSKNQKTAGWVLLGGGAALVGIGFLVGDRKESTFDEAGTGVVVGGIGLLATIGSIPLFIASAKNKKRALAASAYIKMEGLTTMREYSMVRVPLPSIGVKISL